MANDSFDITIKNAGATGEGLNAGAFDTSAFQDSLKKLTESLKNASSSAENYTKKMKDAEKNISELLKKGLMNASKVTTPQVDQDKKNVTTEKQEKKSSDQKMFSGINKLSDSIDKLSARISSMKSDTEQKKQKSESSDRIIKDVKTILAAVGIGSVIKQIADANILAPARATGALIGANVLSNPTQISSNLIQSYQQSVSSTSTAIGTGIGGLLGLGLTLGNPIGGALGAGIGNFATNLYQQNKLATEIPTFQRRISQDFYSNLASQQPRFGSFSQSQYSGNSGGLGGSQAFLDPYLESKLAFGRSFSRYSSQGISPGTSENIINSMSSQGMGSYSELSSLGGLLGQIAKFTGKTADSTGKVFESLNKTGVSPVEGAERLLNLVQGGMSLSQAQKTLQNTANSTSAFTQTQQGYLSASPFQQIQSQFLAQVAGVDMEKYAAGDKNEVSRVNNILQKGRSAVSHRNYGDRNIFYSQILRSAGISGVGFAEGTSASGFTKLSDLQNKTLDTQRESLKSGLKGRSLEEIDKNIIEQIQNSTNSFSALNEAMAPVIQMFTDMYQKSMAHSIFDAGKFFINQTIPSTKGNKR